ncbi:MAG: hypothetical protein ACYSPI_14590, partial [Planctomycetota bacterium]
PSLDNASPKVFISSPVDNATFESGATINFSGTASDTEDGDLTGNIVWTSNIDSSIGIGSSFSTTLGDGIHTIMASVTDSGGQVGSNSITVTVGAVGYEIVVDSILPDTIQAGATIGVTITGSGFETGAEVVFENGGGPTPSATVTSVDGTTIEAAVTVHKKAKASVWDVRVTNPGGSTGVLVGGLVVTP